MKRILIVGAVVLGCALPLGAVEFLGVELCTNPGDTSIALPGGSPLSIVSVEVGKQGALVILLEGDGGRTLAQVDDLMMGLAGGAGAGDKKSLQWSGRSLTAYAEVIKKGSVILAVSSSDPCQGAVAIEEKEPIPPVADVADESFEESAAEDDPATAPDPVPAVAVGVAVDAVTPDSHDAMTGGAVEDFVALGDIAHMKAADDWVDVMGVVVNQSGQGYRLATFDLSFYDDAGVLICVDTISVSVLKDGQERAFRDSIQCSEYVASKVARIELQFAGGY